MPRAGVRSEWNKDKTGSIVTCTHPNCEKWKGGKKEFHGPKVIGDDEARYHRQDHARQNSAA